MNTTLHQMPLTALPGEILNQIYQLCAPPVFAGGCYLASDPHAATEQSLVATCRKVRREAMAFHPSAYHFRYLRDLYHFLSFRTPESLALITHVEIRWSSEEWAYDAILQLSTLPNLRSLAVLGTWRLASPGAVMLRRIRGLRHLRLPYYFPKADRKMLHRELKRKTPAPPGLFLDRKCRGRWSMVSRINDQAERRKSLRSAGLNGGKAKQLGHPSILANKQPTTPVVFVQNKGRPSRRRH